MANHEAMTDDQRRLIFEIAAGEEKLLPVMHKIWLQIHCNRYLAWLKIKGMTGNRLWEWFNVKHGASVHNMLTFIADDLRKNYGA